MDNIDWACGLEIDGNRAFVSEYYYNFYGMRYRNEIKEYDISHDWQYVQTISMGAETTCLAYDHEREIFYSGAYDYEGSYHHLAKHAMDPNDMVVKDIGTCVIGADVDEESGYVFVTTYRYGDSYQSDPNGTLEIWDTSGWTHDPNQNITWVDSISEHVYGPAGVLCLDSSVHPGKIDVTKTDGLNGASVLPGDTFTYTITIDPNEYDHQWVEVVDHLPVGVDYEDVDFSVWPPVIDPNFYSNERAYRWTLGPLDADDDPVQLTITVTVTNAAEPLGTLVNFVTAESDVAYDQFYFETPVGDFGGDRIYVDASAPVGGNGTSWKLAYNYLQDGIARADLMNDDSDDVEIWVANGTYKPGVTASEMFEIPEDVSLFGGYAGYGAADPNERNFDYYPSILSGDIGNGSRNNSVVVMSDDSVLDGFTVEKSELRGIDGSSVDSVVLNSSIKNNEQWGVYCLNGNITIQWSAIYNNIWQGIYHSGSNYLMEIENCFIYNNQRDGIYTNNSIPMILNSVVYRNGLASNAFNTYYGLNFLSPSNQPILRNNTIVYNVNAGIRYSGSWENRPGVKNCIFFLQ